MNETAILADYLAGLSFDDLTPEVIVEAKLRVLDAIGVALHATSRPWVHAAAQIADQLGDGDKATSALWGRSRCTSPPIAALVNGVAVHGIEMDDRRPDLGLHPGAQIVPSAIALAEQINAPGRALLLSVVVGYEAALRIAEAAPRLRTGLSDAVHKGVWGSVAAGSKVLGLSGEQMRNAFGIAGFLAAGHREYHFDGPHSMVKYLTGGWPAQSGVMAAMLAGTDFTGPWTVLEGTHGYCEVFGDPATRSVFRITSDLGARHRILDVETKPYAAWGNSHVVIDAVRELRSIGLPDASEIKSVTIEASTNLIRRAERRPASLAAAQASLPFIAAMAIVHDLTDPNVWSPEVLSDPRILRLVDVVELVLDPARERVFIETRHNGGARVRVRADAGAELAAEVTHSKGTRANPLTSKEVIAKFTQLAAGHLNPDKAEDISRTVMDLESLPDMSTLTKCLLS